MPIALRSIAVETRYHQTLASASGISQSKNIKKKKKKKNQIQGSQIEERNSHHPRPKTIESTFPRLAHEIVEKICDNIPMLSRSRTISREANNKSSGIIER